MSLEIANEVQRDADGDLMGDLSTPYNYHYKIGRMVEIRPDRPGEYVLKLNARLVFDDNLYPGKQLASHELKLTAEGEPAAGCATAGYGATAGLWALLGLLWLRRRR